MESFEERKRQYLEKLRSNEDVLLGLTSNQENYKQEGFTSVLDPQNEFQLEYANLVFTFFADAINIVNTASLTEEEEKKIETEGFKHHAIVELYIKVINALKKGNKKAVEVIKNHLLEEAKPEEIASLYFDLITLFATARERACEYIFKECGFKDSNDELETAQFNAYFEKAHKLINTSLNLSTSKDAVLESPESLEHARRFIEKFDSLYQGTQKTAPNEGFGF